MKYAGNYYQINFIVFNPYSKKGELRTIHVIGKNYKDGMSRASIINWHEIEYFRKFFLEYKFLQLEVTRWKEYRCNKWELIHTFQEILIRIFCRGERSDEDKMGMALMILTETRSLLKHRYGAKKTN